MLLRMAWRNLWRHARRTWITVAAMAFGTAFCMATIALSDGLFEDIFRVLVRQNLGHVQIHARAYPALRSLYETLPGYRSHLESLASLPDLGLGEKAVGARLCGVDPEAEEKAMGLTARMLFGRAPTSPPNREIALGEGLARSLRAEPGDDLVVLAQAADGSMGNEIYRVSGIFRSGAAAFDRGGALVHLEDLGVLLALPDQVHEIVMLARSDAQAGALAEDARRVLGELDPLVRTWDEVNPQASRMMELQDASAVLILGMIFSVAALGVLNTMLMSVFERTRELGVIQALGMRPGHLVALVMLETLMLSTVAGALGLALGLGLDAWLVRHGIDFGMFVAHDTYTFGGAALPMLMRGVVRPWGIVATLIGLYVVSGLAALWPAVQAARVDPVVAMRQDA
jgi:ABC-type lipoprotein release transport system permease subunit